MNEGIITPQTLENEFGGLRSPILELAGDFKSYKIKVDQDNISEVLMLFNHKTMLIPSDGWVRVIETELNYEEWVQKVKLFFKSGKFGVKAAKRMNRALRPVMYSVFLPQDELKIGVIEEWDAKVWDGFGLISDSLVKRMDTHANDSKTKRIRRKKLLKSKRFSLTCMTSDGQLKGHVLRTSDSHMRGFDILVPPDSFKDEVKFHNSQAYISLDPYHGKQSTSDAYKVLLDFQSLVNMQDFWDQDLLFDWLEDESNHYLNAIEDGDLNAVVSRWDNVDTQEDFDGLEWDVAKIATVDGDIRDFSGMIKRVGRMHINRLENTNWNKLRFPFPGHSLYCAPVDAAQASGLDVTVERGSCHLDFDHDTIWLNAEDWTEYIAEIWGGADHDDRILIMPFVDTDGKEKVVTWRNPNEFGEYVILNFTQSCEETMVLPKMNSNLLPERIDKQKRSYMFSEEDLQTDADDLQYNFTGLVKVASTVIKNSGALGAYVNLLMVYAALENKMPDELIARLEIFIDATVKNGLDLSKPRGKFGDFAKTIAENHQIPKILLPRIEKAIPKSVEYSLTNDHWLMDYEDMLREHIEWFKNEIEQMAVTLPYQDEDGYMPRTMDVLTELGITHHTAGRNWMAVYHKGLREHVRINENGDEEPDFDKAADLAMEWLEQHFTEEEEIDVWYGAYNHAYMNRNQIGSISDALLWVDMNLALDALEAAGVIGEIDWDTKELVVRDEPIQVSNVVPVMFQHGWFNWYQIYTGRIIKKQSEVKDIKAVKKQFADWVATDMQQVSVSVVHKVDSQNRQRSWILWKGKPLAATKPGDTIPEGQLYVYRASVDSVEGDLMILTRRNDPE